MTNQYITVETVYIESNISSGSVSLPDMIAFTISRKDLEEAITIAESLTENGQASAKTMGCLNPVLYVDVNADKSDLPRYRVMTPAFNIYYTNCIVAKCGKLSAVISVKASDDQHITCDIGDARQLIGKLNLAPSATNKTVPESQLQLYEVKVVLSTHREVTTVVSASSRKEAEALGKSSAKHHEVTKDHATSYIETKIIDVGMA